MRLNKVEICGVDTSRLETLKEDEKKELLVRARAGDIDARSRLVMGNLRLVLSVIGRFNPKRDRCFCCRKELQQRVDTAPYYHLKEVLRSTSK